MQKHTPGPWAIIAEAPGAAIGYRAIVAIDGENFGETICNPSPMGEANARLIAAAPELLAALLDVIGLAERGAKAGNDPEMTDLWMRGQIANARAVIAKLEG